MTQSVGFHENEDLLDPLTRDKHRAIASLGEEMEAVDWYDQRVKAAHDDELREILAHHNHLYYVLDVQKNDGSHLFFPSATEFERAKADYQRWLEQQRAERRANEANSSNTSQ